MMFNLVKTFSVVFYALVFSVTAGDNDTVSRVYYVQPTDSPMIASNCNGTSKPCHTLSYYARFHNFNSGATLIFLPGNHILSGETLLLRDISNVTLSGINDVGKVNIISSSYITLYCNTVDNLKIEGLNFFINVDIAFVTFQEYAYALKMDTSVNIYIFNNTFQGVASMIYLKYSQANISSCTFQNCKGGAIFADTGSRNIQVYGCIFFQNESVGRGGSIHAMNYAKVYLQGNFFSYNWDIMYGGAIKCFSCTLEMGHRNIFYNNSVTNNRWPETVGGGAIYASLDSEVNIEGSTIFKNNFAFKGGAIYLNGCQMKITGSDMIVFRENKGISGDGGAIYCNDDSSLSILSQNVIFMNNSAGRTGGAIYICITLRKMILSGYFIQNKANQGGAVYVEVVENVTIKNASLRRNSLAAVGVYKSSVTFIGTTRFIQNSGGALEADVSSVTFMGTTCFYYNSRNMSNGGALSLSLGSLSLSGNTLFLGNIAAENGGAVYALGTAIYIQNVVNFTLNTAGKNGGAMYFDSGVTLNLNVIILKHSKHLQFPLLHISRNYAEQYGGAIYRVDNPIGSQCYRSVMVKKPPCFLQIRYSRRYTRRVIKPVQVNFSNNTTGIGEGNSLFGGFLNRCRIEFEFMPWWTTGFYFLKDIHIMVIDNHVEPNFSREDITSRTYELCFCKEHRSIYSKYWNVSSYSGQKFNVSLLAAAQVGTTSTSVTAITSTSTRLETFQTTQLIENGCNVLQYTIFSTKSHEEVKLYADGPCKDTGDAYVLINATLQPCPDGFTKAKDICSCEPKLLKHGISCSIENVPFFIKRENLNCWIGASYFNNVYEGMIIAASCPLEYCKSQPHKFTLNDLDSQCDHNRAGLVCGACAANHSLLLGGSYCKVCSNSYLALILLFAFMGVILVAFLTFLKLTVATAVFNSIIIYSNILQTTRNSIFFSNTTNILTIFLAWMNLDFGVPTCFYDGLDAYVQTWLQFVFPLYVWLLIGAIILTSRYSITVSKLIGHNPIAVLGTLILMSYMKILKIIVEVYSSMELDYPDNTTVTVWYKDANIPYLQSQHLAITIATTLVLIFFFVPYTLLLLLGHKLYRFTGRKYFKWFNRIKPLLESYYAPYKVKTRFWTGLLLLVRCLLYILFLQFSQSPNKTFMAINITFCIFGFLLGIVFAGKIYKKVDGNVAEALVYLNLIVLSASAQAGLNSEHLVNSMVALVFLMLIFTCAYQFHVQYITKRRWWLKFKNTVLGYVPKKKQNHTISPVSSNPQSQDPHKFPTTTVIELREPLLQTTN